MSRFTPTVEGFAIRNTPEIPEYLLNLYPSAFHENSGKPVLLGDVPGISGTEVLESVKILYSMDTRTRGNVRLPYMESDGAEGFDMGVIKMVNFGYRQTEPFIGDDTIDDIVGILQVHPGGFSNDLTRFPFTSGGEIHSMKYIESEDPTDGALHPYDVWFFATRGYLRPLSAGQIVAAKLRKSLPEELRSIVDVFYRENDLKDILPGLGVLLNNAGSPKNLSPLNYMTNLVGAVDSFWVDDAKTYIMADYTQNTPIDTVDDAMTWSDRDLQEQFPNTIFPGMKDYVTRQSMVADFLCAAR
jgi:hypothetical protein